MHLYFSPRDPSFKARHLVFTLFNAVAAGNITAAKSSLRLLKASPVYLQCLDLFSTHLQHSGRNLPDIKFVADELHAFNKDDKLVQTIASKLVSCLSQLHLKPLRALEFAIEEFTSFLKHKYVITPLTTRVSPKSIDNALGDFDDLCNYIKSSRFPTTDSRPLYKVFRSLPPQQKAEFMDNYMEHNHQRQLLVEASCGSLVKHSGQEKSQNNQLLDTWVEQLSEALNTKDDVLLTYAGILDILPRKTVASIVVTNIHSLSVRAERGYCKLLVVVDRIIAAFNSLVLSQPKVDHLRRHYLEFFTKEDGFKLFSHLVKIAIEVCTIPPQMIHQSFDKSASYLEDINGFEGNRKYHAFANNVIKSPDTVTYRKIGTITPHPFLSFEYMAKDLLPETTSVLLPMLVPARPWSSPTEGGYLGNLQPILHSEFTAKSLEYMNRANATSQLQSVYSGLDYLGTQAWAINSKMLEVVNMAMKEKNGMLEIVPPLNSINVEIPRKPKRDDYDSDKDYQRAKKRHYKERKHILQKFHNLKGLRVEMETLVKAARAFAANGDMFYLPHQLDFRSRAYPMVSLLSHYQGDLVRSLMMFWHSQKLEKHGADWLKYQLAANYGKDKLNMQDRLAFVDENMHSILSSANNPFTEKWWQKAEKPWQTLSLCFEIQKLHDFVTKGNQVSEYYCHIPISLDGSCNGLQHYAALGADQDGGESVNLVPNSKNERQDVYSAVLDIVESKVINNTEGESGLLIDMAKSVLSRKLIKQTVMTSVYGVTSFGATAQIEDRIGDLVASDKLNPDLRKSIEAHKRKLAQYLSGKVLDSISELFKGAKRLQDWLLKNCFRVISSWDAATVQSLEKNRIEVDFLSNEYYRPMMWTSISGFPVVQLYLKPQVHVLNTSLQGFSLHKWTKPAPVAVKRQMNGVAPNFIHSLDSVHMFMTCLAAKSEGLSFVAVHDSFWTHSKDIDRLSELIREEFVRLYSTPIVELLFEDMQNTVRNSYQLVWVENKTNELLVKSLCRIRGLAKHTKDSINKALRSELDNNQAIELLVKEYQPQVFHLQKGRMVNYETGIAAKDTTGGIKAWTPFFVKVKLAPPPAKGDLRIEEVKKSMYFFS